MKKCPCYKWNWVYEEEVGGGGGRMFLIEKMALQVKRQYKKWICGRSIYAYYV